MKIRFSKLILVILVIGYMVNVSLILKQSSKCPINVLLLLEEIHFPIYVKHKYGDVCFENFFLTRINANNTAYKTYFSQHKTQVKRYML